MATTVFVFHPNFAASTVNARLAAEAEKQDGVTVRRLYDLYPDFRIDVAAELDARAAAYAAYITSDSLEPLGDYE